MAQILRTTISPDTARAADATGITLDLPVNPLSAILFTIKALNNTVTISDYLLINTLIDAVTNLNISFRGATIKGGTMLDLAIETAILTGWQPSQSNMVSTDNDTRAITVPIVFGRTPFDPEECFPATRRGDLVMTFDVDIADTGYDGLITQIEAIELLDADPKRFLKTTTTSRILDSAGEFDIDLPIGNDLLGVLLRGATTPNTAFTASIGQIALQVDNVEVLYSLTNWESLHGDFGRRLPAWHLTPHIHHMASHVHLINGSGAAAAAYAQATAIGISADANGASLTTGTAARTGITGIQAPAITHTLEQEHLAVLLDNYAFLDFDPMKDGQYALKTAGAARVNLRVTSDVVDTVASRFLPIELVRLQEEGATP